MEQLEEGEVVVVARDSTSEGDEVEEGEVVVVGRVSTMRDDISVTDWEGVIGTICPVRGQRIRLSTQS